jgi:hypothetical protein
MTKRGIRGHYCPATSAVFAFFLFLVGLGFELDFVLAEHELYCLSYISSPFWSGYILEVESCELFPQTGFKP